MKMAFSALCAIIASLLIAGGLGFADSGDWRGWYLLAYTMLAFYLGVWAGRDT